MEFDRETPSTQEPTPKKGITVGGLAWQASGAVLWGVFFSIAPVVEVLYFGAIVWLPLFILRERHRSKRYGFLVGFVVRVAVPENSEVLPRPSFWYSS